MARESQASSEPCMKLRPMNDGFFIFFEVKGDFDVIGHEGRKVDFLYFDNICNERSAGAEHEGALAGNNS